MTRFKKMNIYVGNLSYNVDDRELQRLFEEHGTVSSAKVIIDRDSGRSKGFGFVEMPDGSEARDAISALNQREIDGRSLRVNEARPRNYSQCMLRGVRLTDSSRVKIGGRGIFFGRRSLFIQCARAVRDPTVIPIQNSLDRGLPRLPTPSGSSG
ncbi:MAG TPA: RNA-binding protein [Rhodothermales bacterium]|nr:RNA-binding protein [Rhodothermales bacterium]